MTTETQTQTENTGRSDADTSKHRYTIIFRDMIEDRMTTGLLSNTGTVTRLCSRHGWPKFSGRYAQALVILANTAQPGEDLNYTGSEELCIRAGIPAAKLQRDKTTERKQVHSTKRNVVGGLKTGAIARLAECFERVWDKKKTKATPRDFCKMYDRMYGLFLPYPAARALTMMASFGALKRDIEAFKTQAEFVEARDPGPSTARRGRILNGPRKDIGTPTQAAAATTAGLKAKVSMKFVENESFQIGGVTLSWGPDTEVVMAYKGNKITEISFTGSATVKITE